MTKWTLALVASLFAMQSYAAITAEQKYKLNTYMGKVGKDVQLGTLIDSADTVVSADVTDDSLLVGDLNSTVMKEATGTLSQANIIAMYTTPVTLIAAAGAGKVIIIDEIEFFHDYATAVYSGGGDVTIEYETSGVDINVFDVALVTASADDNWLVKGTTPYVSAAGTSSHFSLTSSANKAVKITNATAVFADGNASNIINYRIRYHVITLLT